MDVLLLLETHRVEIEFPYRHWSAVLGKLRPRYDVIELSPSNKLHKTGMSKTYQVHQKETGTRLGTIALNETLKQALWIEDEQSTQYKKPNLNEQLADDLLNINSLVVSANIFKVYV